tara:strand:+ start:1557 stop:1772 length:216 start_codon:yes stop_codon:yes gene_type:complete
MLRFSKKTESKSIDLGFWFNNRNEYYTLGTFPFVRCKDIETITWSLLQLIKMTEDCGLKTPTKQELMKKIS